MLGLSDGQTHKRLHTMQISSDLLLLRNDDENRGVIATIRPKCPGVNARLSGRNGWKSCTKLRTWDLRAASRPLCLLAECGGRLD